VSDFTVRKARQRTASNIAVETRTGKDGKAQTMPMTPGLVLRELFKSRRGRGVRTRWPAQLFDIGGNAPTATATGWRQLDDR